MNRRTALGFATAAMLAVAGCAGNSGGDSDTYLVGYASSQTGGLAFSDVPASKGVQMAIDEINAKGGIAGKWKIELNLQDGRSEAAQSAVVAQDLISNGVKFLICTSDADPAPRPVRSPRRLACRSCRRRPHRRPCLVRSATSCS